MLISLLVITSRKHIDEQALEVNTRHFSIIFRKARTVFFYFNSTYQTQAFQRFAFDAFSFS